MLIIGIDPGLLNTGWAIIKFDKKQSHFISSGTIKTKTNEKISNRLFKIYDELIKSTENYSINYGSIEKNLVNSNSESSMLLSMARGISLLYFGKKNIEYEEYMPSHVKKMICGNGSAEKNQIEKMLQYYVYNFTTLLKEKKFSHHEFDAIAIAICHGFHLHG
jgi:crossover junction endodeoxyribonuclease RuvC